jgi:hypothetical protein
MLAQMSTTVAYLVFSHRSPAQTARLIRRLRAHGEGSHVVLHHDDSGTQFDPRELRDINNVHLVPPRPITWQSFSHVEAILRIIRWTIDRLSVDWLILLSGQDYPIRPVPEIEAFLSQTQYDGFVKARPVVSANGVDREGFRRYFYRYYRVPGSNRLVAGARPGGGAETVARRAREAQPAISLKSSPSGIYVGFRRIRTPFSERFRCYRGSTWFTIRSSAAIAVARFVDAHRDYVEHYRRTRSSAESFINTILLNSPHLSVFPDHLRYIRFRGGAHPEVLRSQDLEEVLSSGKHFARKFDTTVDPLILDLIDERVHSSR